MQHNLNYPSFSFSYDQNHLNLSEIVHLQNAILMPCHEIDNLLLWIYINAMFQNVLDRLGSPGSSAAMRA
jgi:hypothetical protein